MKSPRWLPRLRRSRSSCPECGASVDQTQCEVCGYDLVRRTRDEASRYKRPV
jgi:predicted amidophosphoribosyltransferase